jgi:hypothetical protein
LRFTHALQKRQIQCAGRFSPLRINRLSTMHFEDANAVLLSIADHCPWFNCEPSSLVRIAEISRWRMRQLSSLIEEVAGAPRCQRDHSTLVVQLRPSIETTICG